MQAISRVPRPRSARRDDSSEDYLERISDLIAAKGYARVSDTAEALGLERSTVSNMLRRLAARGLVELERYRGFRLTARGEEIASRVRARHALLERFFAALGLNAEQRAQEIEDIEHHLGPPALAALEDLLAYWQSRPGELEAFGRYRADRGRTRARS